MIENDYIIGIDIGGTNFRAGLVSSNGSVSNVQIMPSRFLGETDDGVLRLIEFTEQYIGSLRIDGKIYVSVGIPGSVSADKKSTLSVPNIQNADGKYVFDNKEVVETMSQAIGVPVLINRDVNNLLQYDMFVRSLEGKGTVLGFYIGTGFGASAFINGDFLLGKNGVANELGHIPFYKSNKICSCGNKGCAECHASGYALKLLQEEQYPDTFVGDVFKLHSQDQDLNDFVEACALPIATEINIFDPDYVLIGGGVVHMQGFPKKLLTDFVLSHTIPAHHT